MSKSILRNEQIYNNSPSSSNYLNNVKNKLNDEQKELLNQYESSFLNNKIYFPPEKFNYIEYNKPFVMNTDHNEEFKTVNKCNLSYLVFIILIIIIILLKM
jgi:hypothetical protein